jgi:hypothetical protein
VCEWRSHWAGFGYFRPKQHSTAKMHYSAQFFSAQNDSAFSNSAQRSTANLGWNTSKSKSKQHWKCCRKTVNLNFDVIFSGKFYLQIFRIFYRLLFFDAMSFRRRVFRRHVYQHRVLEPLKPHLLFLM